MLSAYIWSIHNVDFNKVLTQWTKTVKRRCDKNATKIQASKGPEHVGMFIRRSTRTRVNVDMTITHNSWFWFHDFDFEAKKCVSSLLLSSPPSSRKQARSSSELMTIFIPRGPNSGPNSLTKIRPSYVQLLSFFFFLTSWRVFPYSSDRLEVKASLT